MMAKLQTSTTTSCRVARAVSGSSQSSSICPDSTLWKNPLIALTVSRARRKMSRTANSPGMAPRMPVPNVQQELAEILAELATPGLGERKLPEHEGEPDVERDDRWRPALSAC